MEKLKELLLILICTLAIPVSYSRDRGFAIECTPFEQWYQADIVVLRDWN